jgi:hypothetical protein
MELRYATNFREMMALAGAESGGAGLQGSDEQDRSGGPMQTPFTDYPRPTTRLGTIKDPGPAVAASFDQQESLDIQASVDLEGLK